MNTIQQLTIWGSIAGIVAIAIVLFAAYKVATRQKKADQQAINLKAEK